AVGLIKYFTRAERHLLPAAGVLSIVSVILLMVQQQQLPVWKNDASLFGHEMKVNPRSMLAPYYYGKLFEESDPEKALGYYEKAHAIDPQAGLPLLQIGMVQQKLGRHTEALNAFNLGTKVSSPLAENWNRLLMLQAELGLHDEAEATIQQGLERFPNELRSTINAANYYLVNRQRPAKAVTLYLKALELDPGNSHCLKGAALCYQRLGEPEKAQALLDRLNGR
ncbi:MAG: tetratricopeptide repeat protein, partial [Verrucomicrobiae bacterium]|nr:tetratricopeptide repeat protein [Verrucomicrobiae bacterium]NNJ86794.1 tetratricopeptide repeat protein [Akkermansiaceae bacterium]